MKINVKAKPGSHEEKVEKVSDPAPILSADRHSEKRRDWCGAGTEFIVSVKEPPVHGLANKAIIRALANHFNVAQSRIRIVSGHTSRQKVVEVG